MKDFKISVEDAQKMSLDEIKNFIEQVRERCSQLKKTKRGKQVLFSAINSINILLYNTNYFDKSIKSHFRDDHFLDQISKKRFTDDEYNILKKDFLYFLGKMINNIRI